MYCKEISDLRFIVYTTYFRFVFTEWHEGEPGKTQGAECLTIAGGWSGDTFTYQFYVSDCKGASAYICEKDVIGQ